MDAIEAVCGALEAAKMDESPEGVAFMDAFSASQEGSFSINADGSITLKSGDVSLDISAEAIAGDAMEDGAEMMEGDAA